MQYLNDKLFSMSRKKGTSQNVFGIMNEYNSKWMYTEWPHENELNEWEISLLMVPYPPLNHFLWALKNLFKYLLGTSALSTHRHHCKRERDSKKNQMNECDMNRWKERLGVNRSKNYEKDNQRRHGLESESLVMMIYFRGDLRARETFNVQFIKNN